MSRRRQQVSQPLEDLQTLDAAGVEEDGVVAEIFEGVAEAAAEGEQLVDDLYEESQRVLAGAEVPEPNWIAARAVYRADAFYPLATDAPKRGERLSHAIAGAKNLSASQTLVVREDLVPFDEDAFDAATDEAIYQLEHDKDGEPLKLGKREKETRDAWILKKDRPGHLEVVLSVTLIDTDASTSHSELARILEGVTKPYSHAYINGKMQALTWITCNPADALQGKLIPIKPPSLTPKRWGASDPPLIADNIEAASMFHIPDANFNADGIRPAYSSLVRLRAVHPLPTMTDPTHPTDNLVTWGIENKGSTTERVVGMNIEQMNQHCLVLGKPGAGKSELIMNRFYCVTCAKNGSVPQAAILIDPHGQTGRGAAARVISDNPARIADLVLINAGDETHTIVYNPLDISDSAQIEDAVDATMALIEPYGFERGNAPAAISLARAMYAAMAEANLHLKDHKLSPLDSIAFLRNPEFRFAVMSLCTSEAADEEFGPEGRYSEAKPDDQAKRAQVPLRVFTELEGLKAYRRMLSSGRSKLDMAALMREHKLVIFQGSRFGKGKKLGEVLSGLIVSQLLHSMEAWGRIDDENTGLRRDGGAIIFGDEAPTWINDDISILLAECRKYNVGAEIYAQHLGQLGSVSPAIQENVLANTATKATFRLDAGKTDRFERSIAPAGELEAKDLGLMPNYHTYSNVLLPSGESTGPMVLAAPPPFDRMILQDPQLQQVVAEVADASRELVALPNDELDAMWEARKDRSALKAELLAASSALGRPLSRSLLNRQAELEAAAKESQAVFADDPSSPGDGALWETVTINEGTAE